MLNVFKDNIFPNFIYSSLIDADKNLIVQECCNLKKNQASVQFSNVNGWQSKSLEGNLLEGNLKNLYSLVKNFCNDVLRFENLNVGVTGGNCWVNINSGNSYNKPHIHPGSDLVAVYYAQAPFNSGNLVFNRTDSSMCSKLFYKNPEATNFNITPEAGRVYVFVPWLYHFVEQNLSEEDRISIAYNFSVE